MSSILAILKRIVEKALNISIYRKLPRGIDVFQDIAYTFKDHKFKTVFDIGANLGQSALYYASYQKGAIIYSFEPVKATYEQLKKNVAEYPNIKCHQLAFGSFAGEIDMIIDGANTTSTMNTIVTSASDQNKLFQNSVIEKVKLDTLSNFCKVNNITHIDFLKIDTEGFDFEVIKGGIEIFDNNIVDFVQVEVGMNPTNKLHVNFEMVKAFMEERGYLLFGIYDQTAEWIEKKPILRRINPTFISKKLSNVNW